MVSTDEVVRIAYEITMGFVWQDKRSRIPNTPDHRAAWDRLVDQIAEIKGDGYVVELPFEIPDVTELLDV